MKRSIAIVLMVILALFLFVACDDGKASDSYCTVSFDPNGGSGSMTPQTVKQGVPTPLSFNGFTRKGSVFRCWNTKADGSGDSYTDNSLITAKAYTRLYAQWLDEVTVSFDANGGTGEMPGQTLYGGIPSPLAANGFRREGYGFKGWNTQADGKGTDYTDEEVITSYADMVLYAQWSNKTASVTFDANGGSGEMASQTVCIGIPSLLSFNGFTKEDCVFTGWNTKADGSGTAYADHGSITADSAVTLYAQWLQTLTVRFDGNGATSGKMPVQTIYKGVEAKLATNAFRRDGMGFIGWNTKVDGSGFSYDDEDEFMPLSSLTLYAQWFDETATVTFDANGGTGTMNPQTVGTNVPSLLSYRTFYRAGHVFKGWNTKADGSGTAYADHGSITTVTDITLYAQWIKELTITFDGNGNTSGFMPLQTVYKGNSAALTANVFFRAGFGFMGWNTKADGTGTSYSDGAFVTPEDDLWLYAQWSQTTATVTFEPNWNTAMRMEPQIVGINIPTLLSENEYERPFYSFRGWNTMEDGTGVSYGNCDIMTTDCDITLYAQWLRLLTITFDGNGSTSGTMKPMEDLPEGEPTELEGNAFLKAGSGFTGWNTEADGTGISYADEEVVTPVEDMTLYAQWTADTVTVTFDANGGTGTMNPQTVGRNKPSLLTFDDYFNPGYIFNGWNTKADGSGTAYADHDCVTLDSDLTLYAQWLEQLFITFQGNGSTSGTMALQPVFEGDSAVLVPNAFKRVGYDFIGWNTQTDGSGTAYADEAVVTPAGDMTLYAQWIGSSILTPSKTTWTDGNTYTLASDVTFTDRITVTGNVTLILTDGCMLNAKKGISVGEGGQLTINGGAEGTGTLIATGSDGEAGIGGDDGNAGTIVIDGGKVNATGGTFAAGIGGAYYGFGGTVIINDGDVSATGGKFSAGIGGGYYGTGADVYITGGKVYAEADSATGGPSGQVGIGRGRNGLGDGILRPDLTAVKVEVSNDGKSWSDYKTSRARFMRTTTI